MRNHKFKHFVLIIATIFSVMVPAFFLSACGGEDSSNSLDGVYLQIGDNNEFPSSSAYYEAEYGFKFNRPDVLNWDQLKIIFEYRDGTRKDQYSLDEKDAKEIGDEYWEKYYRDLQVEGEVRYEELPKENFIDKVLDVGFYKVVLHVAGRDLELNISINQPTSSVNQPKLSYCIAPKSADLSYANQYYNKFKFACPQYKDDFSDINIANLNKSKPVEDMYSLSKCDYIIGPYSSFSAWASFYGEVPYCMLERRKEISLSDFSVVDSFNKPSIS